MKVYTPENMRYADGYTIQNLGVSGTTLMQRAANALYDAASPFLGKGNRFVILCGKGNNGGDGWALGTMLAHSMEIVTCISVLGEPSTNDADFFFRKCISDTELGFPISIINAGINQDAAIASVQNATFIVDAIFGTGFCGDIAKDSIAANIIDVANNNHCFKLSADIPSGANAQNGECSAVTFKADLTVTFAKAKIGMLSYPARNFCGNITIADIGIPEEIFLQMNSPYEMTDDELVKSLLPKRAMDSNKGTFGKLLVYAGSRDMTGAAHLALCGALRSGVGLTVFASDEYVTDVMKKRLSESVFLTLSDSDEDTEKLAEYSKKCSAMLIGCGLGTDSAAKRRTERLIRECECPIILDADGINVLSDNINIISEAKKGILLTPHPLEFSRICGKTLDEICNSRMDSAVAFSEKYNCTLLLKGAGTVICDKGKRICINPVACSSLSKGGSGDVLAGIIASFAAQGTGLYESAVIGAYLHGRAGEELAKEFSEYGVLPSDIPCKVANLLAKLSM